MGKSTQYDTEIIGAFPVIAEYLKKLGVASIVNELVPWEGGLIPKRVTRRCLQPLVVMEVGTRAVRG